MPASAFSLGCRLGRKTQQKSENNQSEGSGHEREPDGERGESWDAGGRWGVHKELKGAKFRHETAVLVN